jgi:hypothetical protein
MNVVNIIGNIAFKYEKEKAEEAYDRFNKSLLNFPNNRSGVLYIETDGAMFNTRIKNDSGSTWCENKLGLIFSSDNIKPCENRKTGEKYNRIEQKEYTAYIGKSAEFKKFLLSCALRNGYGQYKETVLLSDGAKWIKTIKNELFYDAQHILDFFHVKEKIYNFGKTYFDHNETKYKPWCEKACDLLKHSKLNKLIPELTKMEKKVEKIDKSINLVSYLESNIETTDYETYRNKGYFIGSGAIEGANKNVLHKRLKQSGMRWRKDSAQYMVTLRTKSESNKWYSDVILPTREYYAVP